MQNNFDPKELLPCPFCGGPAISGMTLDNLGYAMCASDTCWGMAGYLETEAEAIAAWNRRHLSAVPDGEGELVDGPWRLGGYAPGSYMCICLTCNQAHEADKRATQCVNCAAREAASRLSQAGVRDDRIKALEEALRPFAALGEEAAWMTKPDDAGAWGFDDALLTWGDFRRARSALSGDTL